MPVDLEAARGRARRDADRRQGPDRRQAAGHAKRQVAFRGAPLYRFVQDTKPGQVKGNGFKDVGVWRPVTTGSTKAPAAPTPSPSNSYGY